MRNWDAGGSAVESADGIREHAPWRQRPLILALLGLATGLTVHFLLGDRPFYEVEPTARTLALVTAVTTAAGLAGFTLERRLWWAALLFSVAMGALAGSVMWWNGTPSTWSGGDGWRAFSMAVGLAIAAPLFQAARDAGRPAFPYASVHDHAWTNVVLWGACWLFVAIVFALAYLLAGLFLLIDIHLLEKLLQENWFARSLVGLSFGAAVGLLREHDRVVHLLQRVVAIVLAVLAPVLSAGLLLFVLALPFTGLHALWDATRATTPLLLCCIVGAVILANAVIGNAAEEERRFALLRLGAMGLALVMLPLAVIAAIAVGLRIGQYGYTPERLWALTFVVIASAYGLAYLTALLRGRLEWARFVRPANLNLAFGLCALALLLATPLVSFNAISTRDQVARLQSGKVPLDAFDWRALAFDFGKPGRDALDRLTRSNRPAIRAKAVEAAKAENRWEVAQDLDRRERSAALARNLRVLPADARVPDQLREALVDAYNCTREGEGADACTLLIAGEEAFLFTDSCFPAPAPSPTATPVTERRVAVRSRLASGPLCGLEDRFVLRGGKWVDPDEQGKPDPDDAQIAARAKAYREGRIEIRKVERRQAYVGGVPAGEAFE